VPTVFLGTSAFAAVVLERLAAHDVHRPVLVVTRPDAPQGRGRVLAPPPVALAAEQLGLPVFQPEKVNEPDAVARIEAAGGDLVLCAYGAIVGGALLEHEILNVHPSLLPRWRGAAPLERAIMAGDAQTGVSIMRLVKDLDAGAVCLQAAIAIEPDDTYGTLAPRLEQLSADLLIRALDMDPPTRDRQWTDQDEDAVTYAEKIVAADRTLDPARPAEENVRIVRALTPHIGARLQLEDGSFLGVRDARVDVDGKLELIEVQPAGGRAMSYADYLRGRGGS
jgi:methionyl-tRNA formyltransferase